MLHTFHITKYRLNINHLDHENSDKETSLIY